MKVFIICSELLDGKDARTTHVLEIFKNLAKFCDVYLFAPQSKKTLNIYDKKKIILIPNISTGLLRYLLFDLLLFFYLNYYCLANRPDIIYVRRSIVVYSHILVSKIFRIPFVLEVNGLPIKEFRTRHYKQGLFITITNMLFAKLSERLNYKFAKKIVAVTSGIKRYITKEYKIDPDNISVIMNGANTDLFRPMDKNKIRNKLGLEKKFKYIGFSGSFSHWHGLENLVRSALLILEKSENTKFLLVGDGIMKEQIRQMVSDLHLAESFIFINAVPYEKVSEYVNAFDIGIILKEKNISGSPLKLWEYMACGIPIVATNSEDFHVLEKCNGGILVDPEKPEEIANAMLTLLKNKSLMREMGENGRRYVVKNHSWKNVSKKIEKVCMKTIELKNKTLIHRYKD